MPRLLSFVAVCALAVPSLAQEPGLRYRFEKGQTLRYANTQATKAVIAVNRGGQKQTVDFSQNLDNVVAWQVLEVAEDGTAKVRQKFESFKATVDMPMVGRIAYDSSEPPPGEGRAPADMLKGVYATLAGAAVTFRVTPRGEVRDVDLPKDLIEKMSRMGGGMAGIGSPDVMKQMIETSTLRFPEQPLAEGGEWSYATESDGPMKLTNQFANVWTETTGSEGARTAVIEQTVRTTTGQAAGGTDMTAKSTIRFDLAAGRVAGVEQKQTMKSTQQGADLDVTSTITVKLLQD